MRHPGNEMKRIEKEDLCVCVHKKSAAFSTKNLLSASEQRSIKTFPPLVRELRENVKVVHPRRIPFISRAAGQKDFLICDNLRSGGVHFGMVSSRII